MGMNRRGFIRATSGVAAGATFGGQQSLWGAAARQASDVITLGPDRVKLSRLAIGLGTFGGSVQRRLGLSGVADLLQFGYDQGTFWWDTADNYQTHPHVREGLKRVPREKVTILTKTGARSSDQMRASLDRCRREIGTDYLDIVLLHGLTSPSWPEQYQGGMAALAEAKQKGIVRTYGISCHSLPALEAAAKSPWLRVILTRINPAGIRMDADPDAVVPLYRKLKAAGKGVMGMKILGEGGLRDRVDECLRFVLSLDCVDCFTIGAANRAELADLIRRISPASRRVA